VDLKDEKSKEIALTLNETEFGGKTITVKVPFGKLGQMQTAQSSGQNGGFHRDIRRGGQQQQQGGGNTRGGAWNTGNSNRRDFNQSGQDAPIEKDDRFAKKGERKKYTFAARTKPLDSASASPASSTGGSLFGGARTREQVLAERAAREAKEGGNKANGSGKPTKSVSSKPADEGQQQKSKQDKPKRSGNGNNVSAPVPTVDVVADDGFISQVSRKDKRKQKQQQTSNRRGQQDKSPEPEIRQVRNRFDMLNTE
jgi:hypothetical protein